MSDSNKFGEFNPAVETWTCYTERLEAHFTANKIDDADIKRSILISCVGPKTYGLIRNLISPAKPKEKSFEDLVEVVQKHHHPRPSAIVQRYKFNTCFRQPGQSISEYVAELRRLAEYCDYGQQLETMLRDRIVCGVANDAIQKRLLSEAGLNYKRALEIAQGMEMAARNIVDIQNPTGKKHSASAEINFVKKKQYSKSKESSHQKFNRKDRPQPSHDRGKGRKCYRCGDDSHNPDQCKYVDVECSFCHIKGHIKRACFKRKRTQRHQANLLENVDQSDMSDNEEEYELFTITEPSTEPIMITVIINGQPVTMQFDTGASISIMSLNTFKNIWKSGHAPTLKESSLLLRGYTGNIVDLIGCAEVNITFQNQTATSQLVVARGERPSLFGRNWIRLFNMTHFDELNTLSSPQIIDDVLQKYSHIFQEQGEIKGMVGKIYIPPDAKPVFMKARPLPYAMKEKVDEELDRLLEEGIIEPVQHSEWATPIVPVLKSDKTVRLCGDYKVTVNQACKPDPYPIPRIEDLYAKLSGGESFTKIDLRGAFLQLPLDEKSKGYTTINTHRGLFRFNRLPFGISSSPGIFQRCIDNLLQNIPMTGGYQDDIIISGENDTKHMENLTTVLETLSTAGVRIKKEKCVFKSPDVVYLGHRISAEGLHPVSEKVEAIVNAPAPTNVTELKSFLGLLNYYGKFLQNLSTVLAPLHYLLKKDTRWQWGAKQNDAFTEAKRLLHSAQVLVHFDSDKEVILATDASQYGLGAVLSHKMPDGSQRPISFASQTLNQAEKGYSQIEKEGLSVIFGIKRFHQYLYGRHFLISNDHKPLQFLFGEKKGISAMSSPRIQRWAITLSAYSYSFIYTPGKDLGHADAMSRLPLDTTPPAVPTPPETLFLLEFLESTPVTATDIETWTNHDPLLSRVRRFINSGWPSTVSDEFLRPFFSRRNELSSHGGVILWGPRVVVPEQGRSQILELLHEGHPGMVKMKMFSRHYVWWPGLDQEIEGKVKTCDTCQVNRKTTPPVNIHPWEYPSGPWQRVHIDYAGPLMGKMYLVIVDAYSKWIDVHVTTSSTSEITILKLQESFSNFGLPKTVVSDNGTCFASAEFQKFMCKNGIEHIFTPPYHPGSNGLAERSVQTLKEGIKKMEGGTVESKVTRFLFRYRTLPHSVTGKSPAELMMGRRMRTSLDLVHPDEARKVARQQGKQKAYKDARTHTKTFQVFGSGQRWIPGTVLKIASSVCDIHLADGRNVRRHMDHMKQRFEVPEHKLTVVPETTTPVLQNSMQSPQTTMQTPQDNVPTPRDDMPTSREDTLTKSVLSPNQPETLRRSSRVTRVPVRLDL